VSYPREVRDLTIPFINEIGTTEQREDQFQAGGLKSPARAEPFLLDCRPATYHPDKYGRTSEIGIPHCIDKRDIKLFKPFSYSRCSIVGDQERIFSQDAQPSDNIPEGCGCKPTFGLDQKRLLPAIQGESQRSVRTRVTSCRFGGWWPYFRANIIPLQHVDGGVEEL
jgi:hypothetical protein